MSINLADHDMNEAPLPPAKEITVRSEFGDIIAGLGLAAVATWFLAQAIMLPDYSGTAIGAADFPKGLAILLLLSALSLAGAAVWRLTTRHSGESSTIRRPLRVLIGALLLIAFPTMMTYAGYYVAELLDELTDDGDPHPELFDLACEILAALDSGPEPVSALLIGFELSALRVLGHLPLLDQCVECGIEMTAQGRVAFGMLAGGVLCNRCRPGKPKVVSLSGTAWQMLRDYSRSDASRPTVEPDRRAYGEVRGVLNQYLSHLLGRRPRMHEYLGILAS